LLKETTGAFDVNIWFHVLVNVSVVLIVSLVNINALFYLDNHNLPHTVSANENERKSSDKIVLIKKT